MVEKKRPVLELPSSMTEMILQGVSVVGILGVITSVSLMWHRLPDRIPQHFDSQGKVNEWGGKGTLLILPILVVGLFALITLLERFPHIYNYLTEITEENAEYQYRNARLMMVSLKTELIAVFAYLQIKTILVATGRAQGLGGTFLPVYLLLLFGTIGFFIWRMIRKNE